MNKKQKKIIIMVIANLMFNFLYLSQKINATFFIIILGFKFDI